MPDMQPIPDGRIIYWVSLSIAVLSNIVANTTLKLAANNIVRPTLLGKLQDLLGQPPFWIGILAAGTLLVAFMFAIRHGSVSITYAMITSLAVTGLVVIDYLMFDTQFGASKAVGLALVISGIWILSWAPN